jgi:hypothetical protein
MGFQSIFEPFAFTDDDVCMQPRDFTRAVKIRKRAPPPGIGELVMLVNRHDEGKRYTIMSLGMQVRELMVHWILFNGDYSKELLERETLEWRPKGIIVKIDRSWFLFNENVYVSIETLRRYFGIK